MTSSRRSFCQTLLAGLSVATGAGTLLKADLLNAFATPGTAPPLGLNTWSLRALKHDEAIPAILRVMKETGMRNCQLLFSHAEPEEFDPDFAFLMSAAARNMTAEQVNEQKRRSEARTAWRMSVPMTYFETLRSRFEQQGLKIRSYGAPFPSSAEEIDRLFLMAKTLGATVVNGRLSMAQTSLVADAAQRYGLFAGIQVSDPPILAQQLRASDRLRADPDLGDLTKAGFSALEFIKQHLNSVSSIDLKDAVTGGGSVPFGSGGAQMAQVLEFLVNEGSHVELYIDCDYPGTGTSTDEVKRCVSYVRKAMQA